MATQAWNALTPSLKKCRSLTVYLKTVLKIHLSAAQETGDHHLPFYRVLFASFNYNDLLLFLFFLLLLLILIVLLRG